MTLPVIRNLLQQYPDVTITFVSAAFHAPLFAGIERLHFVAADLKGRHKGFAGLFRLFRQLNATQPVDAVADLHQVLRTRVLQLFFTLGGTPWATLDKGRKEKAELTRTTHKLLRPLPSTFQRYADVFGRLGLPIQLNIEKGYLSKSGIPAMLAAIRQQGGKAIGIAPFAQYERKTYPADKMKEVVRMLARHANLHVFLLGGKNDQDVLQSWAAEIPGVTVLAGTMRFAEELPFIGHLDAVVSMDSANMHLASLYGVPVVSIWGATHPYAGFYGWGQHPANAVQLDLACRPCSVFGNKAGPREDLACMYGIAPLAVYQRIAAVLWPE